MSDAGLVWRSLNKPRFSLLYVLLLPIATSVLRLIWGAIS